MTNHISNLYFKFKHGVIYYSNEYNIFLKLSHYLINIMFITTEQSLILSLIIQNIIRKHLFLIWKFKLLLR